MLQLVFALVAYTLRQTHAFKRSTCVPYISHRPTFLCADDSSAIDTECMYDIECYEPHPHTVDVALKHARNFRVFADSHVLSAHTVQAFSQAAAFVKDFYKGSDEPHLILLDSGCGTGRSSFRLATLYPNMPVIAVDRSIFRLSKNKAYGDRAPENTPANLIFLRADLIDFFMLAHAERSWVVHSHYILYPNPYPKSKHLKRRFHGHPILPVLLALGGTLRVRSNWVVYLDEMKKSIDAIRSSGWSLESIGTAAVMPHIPNVPLTNFEAKFKVARVELYELTAHLGLRDAASRTELLDRMCLLDGVGEHQELN